MKNSKASNSPICRYIGLGLLVLSGFSIPAWSQAVYGSVRGRVTDISGEPISRAAITVTSVEKGTREETVSNSSGFFTITHLLSDNYNLKAEAPGYKAREIQGETVYADQDLEEVLQLEKGSGTGTVQFAEASSPLKTDRADVATSLSEREVQDLPNFQRNFTAFELLAPGAIISPILENTARPSQNPQQGLTIYQNGQHFGGSAFQLDGTDNRDPIAGLIVVNPSLEAISEIKITTQNFDAEFGQAIAGLVTAQTRSGSNSWHGSAFEFRHSDWAEASAPDLANSNVTNNQFKINQFGGSLGGPILKNRLFIFGDYQGNRRALDFTKFTSVPTQTVISTCLFPTSPSEGCDLSDYASKAVKSITCPISLAPYLPPSTCVPPTGLIIPQSDLAPQSVALLKLLPSPNVDNPIAPTVQNYTATGVEPWNDDEFDIRVDQNLNEKLKLFGRYSFFDSRLNADGIFNIKMPGLGGTGLSGDNFAGNSQSRNQSVSYGFDYLLSPTLTTDFRFGFYRYHVNILQGGLNTTPASNAGIQGLNLGDMFTSGMPSFSIQQPRAAAVNGNITFGYSQEVNSCNCPLLENERQFQWANNWTKIRGNHTFKWGVDFRYAQNLRVPSDRHRAGHLVFSSQTTGLGLASFLMGFANSFNRYYSPTQDYSAGERQHRYFSYGQDTWRVTSHLTLTYGLRWEIYVPQSVTGSGQGGFLDIGTGLINVAGTGTTDLHGNVQNSFDNFAPRVGFAYQALPHTVIRGAYGRSFDLGALGAVFGDSVTQNPPVLEFQQLIPQSSGQAVLDLRDVPLALKSIQNTPTNASSFPLPNGIAANVVPSKIRIPTVDAWNVTIQQQLSPRMSMQLAYVANKGTHVFPFESSDGAKNASFNMNQATIQGYETLNSSLCAKTGASLPCVSTISSRQPFFAAHGWTQTINYFANNASDRYESLQAEFDRRLSQSFQFRAAYTWSRAAGYVEEYFGPDPKVNYGPDDFDRRHALTLNTLWELPIGRGKRLLGNAGTGWNRVLGGWEINTISYVYSGLPFTPSYNECASDIDPFDPCRPNLVGPINIIGDRNNYFTPAAGALSAGSATCPTSGCVDAASIIYTPGQPSGPWQRPAPGNFGDVGRNSFRGPWLLNTDLALLKSVTLTERSTLQFRAVMTNLFNRVNLGLPNPCVDCGTGTTGVIANLAQGASMRQFEFALKLQF